MIAERKAAARLEARAKRKAIPIEARREKSARIAAATLALPEVARADTIACYASVQSEVETRGLLASLLATPKRVLVPVVTPPERMHLVVLSRLDDLRVGAHAIPEPPAGPISDAADVILLPGLLFSTDGHRLGQGGGYFDRLLRAMPRAFRVGLAFDEQVVAHLPMDAHDEPMDVIVTDEREFRCKRAATTR